MWTTTYVHDLWLESFPVALVLQYSSNFMLQPASATLFEQACNERMQQFDENDTEEDLWETKEITFSKQISLRTR